MSNTTDWTCIYKTTRKFDADVVHGNLLHAGIESVILNKQDAYLNGYVEIHVPTSQKEEAESILNNPLPENN